MFSRKQNDYKRKGFRAYRYSLYLLAGFAIIIALPPWYSHYLQMGSIERKKEKDYISALHLAERAVNVNPLSVEALFIQAGTQQRLGRESTARNTLIKATQLQPLNYATWELLAKYERDLWNQEELSQEHFAMALSLNPYGETLQEDAGAIENQDT